MTHLIYSLRGALLFGLAFGGSIFIAWLLGAACQAAYIMVGWAR